MCKKKTKTFYSFSDVLNLSCSFYFLPGTDVDHLEVIHEFRDDMSNELWVDAFEEWGHLPASCPNPTSSDNTSTSNTEAKIGSLERANIERWSSSDSWASALSDWIQCVSFLPEDHSTMRSHESQNQLPMTIQDTAKEKFMDLESSSGRGDRDSEGKMLIEHATSPPEDLSLQHKKEKERSLYANLVLTRIQDLPKEIEGKTQSGLQEEVKESRNDHTQERPEDKVKSKTVLSVYT